MQRSRCGLIYGIAHISQIRCMQLVYRDGDLGVFSGQDQDLREAQSATRERAAHHYLSLLIFAHVSRSLDFGVTPGRASSVADQAAAAVRGGSAAIAWSCWCFGGCSLVSRTR